MRAGDVFLLAAIGIGILAVASSAAPAAAPGRGRRRGPSSPSYGSNAYLPVDAGRNTNPYTDQYSAAAGSYGGSGTYTPAHQVTVGNYTLTVPSTATLQQVLGHNFGVTFPKINAKKLAIKPQGRLPAPKPSPNGINTPGDSYSGSDYGSGAAAASYGGSYDGVDYAGAGAIDLAGYFEIPGYALEIDSA